MQKVRVINDAKEYTEVNAIWSEVMVWNIFCSADLILKDPRIPIEGISRASPLILCYTSAVKQNIQWSCEWDSVCIIS